MAQDMDIAVEEALSGGLEEANEATILYSLADALPPPRVLGGMPHIRALAFIETYAEAIHNEICDPDRGRVKDSYQSLLGGDGVIAQVKALAPIVLNYVGAAPGLVAPMTVAALVALWMVKVGLDRWCLNTRV